MNEEALRIRSIFMETFLDITKKVAGITLRIASSETAHLVGGVYSGIIITRGVYKGIISCCMEEKVRNSIIMGMNHGKMVQKEEENLYIKEYLNIVYGRAISNINNYFNQVTRFSIPITIKGEYNKIGLFEYKELENILFECSAGKMKLTFSYDIRISDQMWVKR